MILYNFQLGQLEASQNFIILEKRQSIQSHWKELHKKKQKKWCKLTIRRLKKIKLRVINKNKKHLFHKMKYNNYKKVLCFSDVFGEAHQALFGESKESQNLVSQFYNDAHVNKWKSRLHLGYTFEGEVLNKKYK